MIIGLVGFIGSGKGTVGEILHTNHGYKQDSFATPLKDAIASIFGWDREFLEGATEASRIWREVPDPFWSEKFGYNFTPRLALQLMGTEAGRNVFHNDVWVLSLLRRNEGHNVAITDVRFRNEIAAIKRNGGIVVRVRRGQNPFWYTTALQANSGDQHALECMKEFKVHVSEWDWVGTPMDYTLYNDGTFADLKNNVEALLTSTQ